MTKKTLPPTAVWQNGGFRAKLNIRNSIEHCANFVHLCFDFRHFAKLQTVTSHIKYQTKYMKKSETLLKKRFVYS